MWTKSLESVTFWISLEVAKSFWTSSFALKITLAPPCNLNLIFLLLTCVEFTTHTTEKKKKLTPIPFTSLNLIMSELPIGFFSFTIPHLYLGPLLLVHCSTSTSIARSNSNRPGCRLVSNPTKYACFFIPHYLINIFKDFTHPSFFWTHPIHGHFCYCPVIIVYFMFPRHLNNWRYLWLKRHSRWTIWSDLKWQPNTWQIRMSVTLHFFNFIAAFIDTNNKNCTYFLTNLHL